MMDKILQERNYIQTLALTELGVRLKFSDTGELPENLNDDFKNAAGVAKKEEQFMAFYIDNDLNIQEIKRSEDKLEACRALYEWITHALNEKISNITDEEKKTQQNERVKQKFQLINAINGIKNYTDEEPIVVMDGLNMPIPFLYRDVQTENTCGVYWGEKEYIMYFNPPLSDNKSDIFPDVGRAVRIEWKCESPNNSMVPSMEKMFSLMWDLAILNKRGNLRKVGITKAIEDIARDVKEKLAPFKAVLSWPVLKEKEDGSLCIAFFAREDSGREDAFDGPKYTIEADIMTGEIIKINELNETSGATVLTKPIINEYKPWATFRMYTLFDIIRWVFVVNGGQEKGVSAVQTDMYNDYATRIAKQATMMHYALYEKLSIPVGESKFVIVEDVYKAVLDAVIGNDIDTVNKIMETVLCKPVDIKEFELMKKTYNEYISTVSEYANPVENKYWLYTPEHKVLPFPENTLLRYGMATNITNNIFAAYYEPIKRPEKKPESDDRKEALKQLAELRKTVPPVTPDTIMQKVLSPSMYDEYINDENPLITVSGRAYKAADSAPCMTTPKEMCDSLQLDYDKTTFVDREKDIIYIMRFNSDYCPSNNEFPKSDNDGLSCTGTGFTGGTKHLIPEYEYPADGAKITNGAIYTTNSQGKESACALWDKDRNRFKKC